MDFEKIKVELEKRKIDFSEYEETYKNLYNRKENTIKARAQGEWGEKQRINEYSLVLRQVLLHRATKLFEGSFDALINDNAYSMSLSIRGHFETTAAIGYLHNRLHSLQQGNLDFKIVDQDIVTQLMGTKDKSILEKHGHKCSEAKHVLKMLKYADKSVSKHIMQGSSEKFTYLMDLYEYLCEFSHPNFHSNTLAYSLDKEQEKFIFRYDEQIRDRDARLIENLLISNPIFVDLYDRIEELLL